MIDAGAVMFGIDPTVVGVRRSRLTYGVGVLHRFLPSKHPSAKKITRDNSSWCKDVFDRFVVVDQEVRPTFRGADPGGMGLGDDHPNKKILNSRASGGECIP